MIQKFTFNPLGENTYVIWCGQSMEAAVVDPGNYDDAENHTLLQFIERSGLQVTHILNTHAHIDHIFGNAWAKETFKVPLYLHSEDRFLLERSIQMAALWGLNYRPSPEPDVDLKDLQTLQIGKMEIEIRHVPGHAPGHVVFIQRAENWVLGGDTLFAGSIGRTDLPGGNHQQLLTSIQNQMFVLPTEMVVYSGHGPETTIGEEKEYNPFFRVI